MALINKKAAKAAWTILKECQYRARSDKFLMRQLCPNQEMPGKQYESMAVFCNLLIDMYYND